MNNSTENKHPSQTASVDLSKFESELRLKYPNKSEYLGGGFYLNENKLEEEYTDKITKEAYKLYLLKKEKYEKVESLVLSLKDLENCSDILSLPKDRYREILDAISEINKKRFIDWAEPEKELYRFWANLPKLGLDISSEINSSGDTELSESPASNWLLVIGALNMATSILVAIIIFGNNSNDEYNMLSGSILVGSIFVGGLVIVGFSKIIEYTNYTHQRLERIEKLFKKHFSKKLI